MSFAYDQTWTFGFLFRLAARAHRLPRAELVRRLLVGLANRFDAVTCSFYDLSGSAPSRSTEPADAALPVAGELRRISAAVAKHCRTERKLVSALDVLDLHGEDQERIEAALGPCDTFGFPLVSEGQIHGCIVLCLRGDEALSDADLHALLSVGECLQAALANAEDRDRGMEAA